MDNYQKKLINRKKHKKKYMEQAYFRLSTNIKVFAKQKQNELVLDVGTGAGFPGMVYQYGRTDLVLCDKSFKKINFLRLVAKM